jgi:hypothetical protein
VLYDLINRTVSTRNEADLEALQARCALHCRAQQPRAALRVQTFQKGLLCLPLSNGNEEADTATPFEMRCCCVPPPN